MATGRSNPPSAARFSQRIRDHPQLTGEKSMDFTDGYGNRPQPRVRWEPAEVYSRHRQVIV